MCRCKKFRIYLGGLWLDENYVVSSDGHVLDDVFVYFPLGFVVERIFMSFLPKSLYGWITTFLNG